MRIDVEPDPLRAGQAAAALIARRLQRAVRDRGRASVAFSGGSTPAPMFDALAAGSVPWERVDVFQVDERVAPDGDPARNSLQLRERLLGPAGVPSLRIHLMPVTAAHLDRACARCARQVDACAPLDVVHLGLGDDGHTASWPPGDPVADSALAVDLSGEYRGVRRMTLTPRVVNAARTRVVLVAGASKAAAVDRWLAGDRSLPVARVRRTNTILVLDEAARWPGPGSAAR